MSFVINVGIRRLNEMSFVHARVCTRMVHTCIELVIVYTVDFCSEQNVLIEVLIHNNTPNKK